MTRRAVLALASEPQEAILGAALAAHGIALDTVPPGAHLETMVLQAMHEARDGAPPLLVIDLAALAQLATHAPSFCAWKSGHCAEALLYLYCSGLYTVPAHARAWAQKLNARDLLPGCDLAHWRASLLPTLATLLAALELNDVDEAATERALKPLPAMLDHSTQVAHAWRQREVLDRFGSPPEALLAQLRKGVAIRARRYRVKTYDECFVGADAVDCLTGLAQAAGAPHARSDVLPLGQALLELNYIYHVARDQPFRDGNFFYRFTADTPRLAALDLNAVIAHLHHGGVRIGSHKYHGLTYADCFVGAQAVACLRDKFNLSENEAMTLGQQLVDLFVVHHVVDQRLFRNGRFFYRFYEDEV